MTTTQLPPQPPRPSWVPEGSLFNSEQWFTFNTTTGQWDLVPEPATPELPPLPTPGAFANGQAQEKQERPPPVYGDFATFWTQQSSGGGEGKFWKFNELAIGTSCEGVVARDILETDTRAQTDKLGNTLMQNGQEKLQLQVPMLMMPGGLYPDGHGVAVFKVGEGRDKLSSAMQYAGAPLTYRTLDTGTQVSGFVPQKGAYIRMTKVDEQKGTSQKGTFTRFIYEVIYRCPEDPFAVQKRAEIEAAHKAMEDLGPPPEQPAAGSPPQAFIDYANALTAYQTKLAATTNGHPAPATTAPPAAAAPPAPLPPPAAAAPPVPTPAPPVQAVQAAATQVATADAGLPPAGMPTPAPQPPVPPPASTTPAPQPAAVPTTAPAAAPATAPAVPATATPVSITREQWQQMAEPVRLVVSEQTGMPIPADLITSGMWQTMNPQVRAIHAAAGVITSTH